MDLTLGIYLLAIFGFFFAGCACCGSCELLSDTFDRADSTSLGGDWTEVSGNWEIASNELKIPATTNAVVISTTTNPDGETTHIEVAVKVVTSGDIARIILNYLDSSNYYFVEFRAGALGHLRIFSRVAGVNTQLATVSIAPTANTYYTVRACISESGVIGASWSTLGSAVRTNTISATSSGSNGTFGLGTGGTAAGNIMFNDFVATKVSVDCTVCSPCPHCDDDLAPAQVQVVISGVTDTGCTDCDTVVNATFVCDFVGGGVGFSGAATNDCHWKYAIPSLCTRSDICLWVWITPTAIVVSFRIGCTNNNGGQIVTWIDSTSPPTDCTTWSNENIPFTTFTINCDATASTCLLSAL